MADAGPPRQESNLRTRLHELTQKDGAPFVPYAVWKIYFRRICHLGVAACAAYFGRTDHPVSRTRRSSKRRQDPITSSCGCTRCFRSCSLDGDTGAAHRPSSCLARCFFSHSVRRGRKKLAPPSDCRSHDPACRRYARDLYSSRGYTPWSPEMNAWSSDPIPARFLQHRTALERQGALVSR